jgi:hypothetical protein
MDQPYVSFHSNETDYYSVLVNIFLIRLFFSCSISLHGPETDSAPSQSIVGSMEPVRMKTVIDEYNER